MALASCGPGPPGGDPSRDRYFADAATRFRTPRSVGRAIGAPEPALRRQYVMHPPKPIDSAGDMAVLRQVLRALVDEEEHDPR
jgi:hypothetical protein